MATRKSTRNRGVRSKYFPNNEPEIDDKDEVDNDLDYDPILESDNDKISAKSRKRKSTSSGQEKSKGTRQTKAKVAKKVKSAKVETVPDKNNNKSDMNSTSNNTDMNDDSDDDNAEDWEEVPDAEKVFDSDAYQPDLPSNLKVTFEFLGKLSILSYFQNRSLWSKLKKKKSQAIGLKYTFARRSIEFAKGFSLTRTSVIC